MRPSRSVHFVWVIGAVLALWGCSRSPDFVAKPEPWRDDADNQCIHSNLATRSPFVRERAALGGPSLCGARHPFEMSAAAGGRVRLHPVALLRCPMLPAVDRWVQEVVTPAARRHFGQPVVELKVAASYGCRPMNHVRGARLSEHGYANALDVSAFQLADGRWISVKGDWWGGPRERGFLRHVHQGACDTFSTVLGPNYDANHRDHFHMDLARHGRNGSMRICK